MEVVEAENRTNKLSLAVWLVDDYTGKQPIGDISLAIGEHAPVRNPSGYYLFLDLAAGDYSLEVRSQYYFDIEAAITLPLSGEPVSVQTLMPKPEYPFSRTATLIRGKVSEGGAGTVSGATVKITGSDVQNQTTEKTSTRYLCGVTRTDGLAQFPQARLMLLALP